MFLLQTIFTRKTRNSQKIFRPEADFFLFLVHVLDQECTFTTAEWSLKVKFFSRLPAPYWGRLYTLVAPQKNVFTHGDKV